MSSDPAFGIGHVVLSVRDLEASFRFYTDLGLQLFHIGGNVAIFELRGGTHLLLLPRQESSEGGDTGALNPERVDLMISGRTRGELEACRTQVLARGLKASAIPGESLYGHFAFVVRDPDENEVIVATSHSSLTET
jgi:catechol 2,3-dioxygenase-like lactoylglutathione lyase family enzyme